MVIISSYNLSAWKKYGMKKVVLSIEGIIKIDGPSIYHNVNDKLLFYNGGYIITTILKNKYVL